MKNSNYTIGNRTRDFPACNAVLQPTKGIGKSIKLSTQASWSTLLQLKLIVVLLPGTEISCSHKGRFTHSMPCPCRAHAVPIPCRATKDLEIVFLI